MPNFWEFPTVSMGLGPIMAIYQARFNHYLEDRGLHPKSDHKVWAFLGDGETDEPEALGAITLAARERLDNLIFVVNCNLQRLDGPVRGNGKIIQELEGHFRGAGWNVIKVIWGADWDPLLAKDTDGLLVRRMGEVVDGESQKYSTSDGAYIREHFFGGYPELDGDGRQYVGRAAAAAAPRRPRPRQGLRRLQGGGRAQGRADRHPGSNHQGLRPRRGRRGTQHHPPAEEARTGRAARVPHPLRDSALRRRGARCHLLPPAREQPRDDLPPGTPGGPRRTGADPRRALRTPPHAPRSVFEEFAEGSDGRDISTTMAFVRILTKLLKDKQVGKLIVPIIPDEARTFGMESLFRQIGIYSHAGQLYEPVDADTLLYYHEAKDGQLLEEGITEAGSMCSFIAAGTAHATHGINTIPFFIFYSMFGLQRIGDLIWAAADMRSRGFLIGGTAGRTTLNGEGLQHQDGNSHLLAYPVPNLKAYDPAFAYELAVIIQDGIRRMYVEQEDVFYYITVENEPYAMPAQPEGCEEGILRGTVQVPRLAEATAPSSRPISSAAAPSSTRRCGPRRFSPKNSTSPPTCGASPATRSSTWTAPTATASTASTGTTERRTPWIQRCLGGTDGVYVVASDYVKALPESIGKWFPKTPVALGTDGFGRSESRAALRRFFEVDAEHIVVATLSALADDGLIERDVVQTAIAEFGIDLDAPNPVTV